MHPARRRQRGFTYLGMIILVAILGLVGAAGLKMGSLLQRQAAEQDLLDIGAQFSDALHSYASVTPVGQPSQPASLAALLRDPRFPQTRRHLRKLFVDPITGRAQWGLIYQPGGNGIIGVYSLSRAAPLKVGHFEPRFAGFEGKLHLSDWQFMVANQLQTPPQVPPPAAIPGMVPPAPAPVSAPLSAPPPAASPTLAPTTAPEPEHPGEEADVLTLPQS